MAVGLEQAPMQGGFRPGFRPRLPPPESEETIYR